jgi:HEAT repeat protein
VRVGELSAKEAVPSLAVLLSSEHLSVYARYGLEPIHDPSADDALRSALPKLKGIQLIGVINSLGKRRDAKAIPALTKMIYGSDADVARAAIEALGAIGGVSTVKDLQTALGKTSGLTKVAVADASLVCAERLLAQGKRDEAMALYAFLSAPDVPKAARLGAMASIIREETSVTRPK